MSQLPFPNCCRLCGATSYRHVIARDVSGAMSAAGLYQCSGCSVVFADPASWREGTDTKGAGPQVEGFEGSPKSLAACHKTAPDVPQAPDFRTYGIGPLPGPG